MSDDAPPERTGGEGGWPRDEGSATRHFATPDGPERSPAQGRPEPYGGPGDGDRYGREDDHRARYGADPRRQSDRAGYDEGRGYERDQAYGRGAERAADARREDPGTSYRESYGPGPRGIDGYGRSPMHQGPPPREDGFQPWDEYQQGPLPGSEAFRQFGNRYSSAAGGAFRRVRSMSWQELMLRIPGALAILSGVFVLIACAIPWHSMFRSGSGQHFEVAVAPFRGMYVKGGSRWSDPLLQASFGDEMLNDVHEVTIGVGATLVVAALLLLLGGLAVATLRFQTAGMCSIVLGLVALGYARISSGIVGNVVEGGKEFLSTADDFVGTSGKSIDSLLPQPALGLGVSTFALWVAALAVVVYLAMIVYREWIRFRRWAA